jgi:hypothetical protein
VSEYEIFHGPSLMKKITETKGEIELITEQLSRNIPVCSREYLRKRRIKLRNKLDRLYCFRKNTRPNHHIRVNP